MSQAKPKTENIVAVVEELTEIIRQNEPVIQSICGGWVSLMVTSGWAFVS